MERAIDNSLTKRERLCGKSVIAELFKSEKTLFCYPFRCMFSSPTIERVRGTIKNGANETKPVVSVLFSVPKRKIKLANRRNLLKRRMKEAYRLNKHPLVESVHMNNKGINLALVYVATDIIEYPKIETAIKTLLIEVEKVNK